MTNRENLIALLENDIGADLRMDLECKMEIYTDPDDPENEGTTYDLADALWEVLDWAESEGVTKTKRQCIDVLIKAGYYRPRPANVEVYCTGRDYSPVRKGVRYDEPDGSWEDWLGQSS